MRAWPIYGPYLTVGLGMFAVWPRDRYEPRQLRWFAAHSILAAIAWACVSLIILFIGVPMWLWERARRVLRGR